MESRQGLAASGLHFNDIVAGATGLEPATSCVTGRRSNQLPEPPSACSIRNSRFGQLSKRSTEALAHIIDELLSLLV